MPNLTLDDGRVIEDIKLILSEQKEYYKTYIPVNKRRLVKII